MGALLKVFVWIRRDSPSVNNNPKRTDNLDIFIKEFTLYLKRMTIMWGPSQIGYGPINQKEIVQ